jgi:hypothetical protein
VSGRHRPAGHTGRPSAFRTPLSIVAVAALVAVTAIAVRVMAADANGCGGGVGLSVAAAPEIAPAIEDAADEWAKTNPEVNGKCIRVEVRAVAAADVAASLATRGGGSLDVAAKPVPTPEESAVPAVWIPDSTAWLSRDTAVDRTAHGEASPPLAASPVVFAVPESLARTLAGAGGTGAESLLATALTEAKNAIGAGRPPQFGIGILEPRRDSASLAGAMIVRDAVVTDESKVPNLIAVYRAIYRGQMPDLATLTKAFGKGVQAAPMSEQAVTAFNGTNPAAPLAAIPFAAGGPTLDYPFATLNGKPREVDAAAAKLRTALTDPAYRASFTKRGFRAPDGTAGTGFPVGHGVTAQQIALAPLDNAERVAETLGLWGAANAPSRALALIDVSASMSRPLGGATRMEVLKAAAVGGLKLFTDSSALGMWTYSATHRELAPILPLDQKNRQALDARIATVKPSESADSALFETLRDAYKMMIETYDPEVANRIIVFTDGRSSTAGIKSVEQLARALETIAVVTKPIEVTLIGVGPEVDMAELTAIGKIVGGQPEQILDPAQIQSVFLRALQD